jgi:hypothetical protein
LSTTTNFVLTFELKRTNSLTIFLCYNSCLLTYKRIRCKIRCISMNHQISTPNSNKNVITRDMTLLYGTIEINKSNKTTHHSRNKHSRFDELWHRLIFFIFLVFIHWDCCRPAEKLWFVLLFYMLRLALKKKYFSTVFSTINSWRTWQQTKSAK